MATTTKARRAPKRPKAPATHAELLAREYAGIQRFLARLDGLEKVHGIEWVKRMRRYYKSRLADLRAAKRLGAW